MSRGQEREIRMQERAEREKRRQEEKSLRMDNKVSGITDATTLKAPKKTKKAEAKPVSVSEESRDVRQLQIKRRLQCRIWMRSKKYILKESNRFSQ